MNPYAGQQMNYAPTSSTKNSRPIIFSGSTVKALLAGQKTQTRRVVKVTDSGCRSGFITPTAGFTPRRFADHVSYCPYGQPGDHLWVRETWCLLDDDHWWEPGPRDLIVHPGKYPRKNACAYKADDTSLEGERCRKELGYRWKSPRFMPRWASRITLEITEVRVQRVQEISEEDAKAEGILDPAKGREYHWSYRKPYADLWDSLNAKRGYAWESNPWVWVVEFAVQKTNNQLLGEGDAE